MILHFTYVAELAAINFTRTVDVLALVVSKVILALEVPYHPLYFVGHVKIRL